MNAPESLSMLKLHKLQQLKELRSSIDALASRRMSRYLYDPVAFCHDLIDWRKGEGLTKYQEDILGSIPEKKRVAVRSGHGSGKTGTVAFFNLWFALTRDVCEMDWKAMITAGVWRQLTQFAMPEIKLWSRRIRWDLIGREPFSPRNELLDLSLKLKHGAIHTVASNDPAKVEGAHGSSLAYTLDESKIIIPGVWDAVEGAFSNAGDDTTSEAFALAVSTPGPPTGRFYDIHMRKPGTEDWYTRHVTLAETIAAGRVSQDWAEQRKRQWGEESSLYQAKVLGQFCADDTDSVIPLAWIEAAVERWHVWNDAGRPAQGGPLWTGVDVGRGGDSSVLAMRDGPAIELEILDIADTMAVADRVAQIPGRHIIDVLGVGAGVFDRLRQLKKKPVAYAGSGKSTLRDRSKEFVFTNCLTADARIRPIGNLLRVYRSRHQGPLFEVKTAGGDHFTATPNHQVLTHAGWVAVQSLNVGDKLCDPSTPNPSMRLRGVRPEVHNVPPAIGEVYRAANNLFGSERVECAAVNFHGDRPTSEVDVVTVDCELLPINPTCGEASEDLALVLSLLRQGPLLSAGAPDQSGQVGDGQRRVGAILPDCDRGDYSTLSVLNGTPVVHKVVRLMDSSRGDTSISQDATNNVPVCSESPADLVRRLAVKVPPDDLLLVDSGRPPQPSGFSPIAQMDPVIAQNATDDVLIETHFDTESIHGVAGDISGDQGFLVNVLNGDSGPECFSAAAWLDAVFVQDVVDGGPVSPENLRERLERLAGLVSVDEVVSVELCAPSFGHDAPFVYTLETSTGSYMSQNVAHRNCRSAAYWRVRELLDPDFEPTLMLPPDDLLISDLTTPKWEVPASVPPKIKVENKEDVVERLGRSPDRGDGVVMSLYADHGRTPTTITIPTGTLPRTGLSPLSK